MTESLVGSVAIVTGGSGNLGPIWVGALLDAGASVISLDRPGAPVEPALDALADRFGGRLVQVAASVTDKDGATQALLEGLAGRAPAVLVNNAGIDQPPGPTRTYATDDFPQEVFEQVLSVNVVGAFVMCQIVGPLMAAAGHGSIINVGSLYASVSPDPRLYDHLPTDPPFLKPPAYGASKAALVNLTRYLAVHWASAGIRVNALSPGGIAGGQDPSFVEKFRDRVPLRRMGDPDELAGPLLFLASSASSYVTGHELVVDGGFTAL